MEGADCVKLNSLKVKNLYDCYNYSVDFNSDVTFLYGANGCGKTTILNIIEDIITGKIYKLFQYKFSLIELAYYNAKKRSSLNYIYIRYSKNDFNLVITFNKTEYTLALINEPSEQIYISNKSENDITNEYFRAYPFLKVIKDTFNYVYLPLNRRTSMPYPERMVNRRNRMIYEDYDNIVPSSSDFSMRNVELLIRECYISINAKISEINDNFRNQLLKSLLNINREYDLQKIAFGMYSERPDKRDILKTQIAYMKILKDINQINEEEERQYNKFFDDFIKELEVKDNGEGVLLNQLLKFNEVKKIKEIVSLAEKMEIDKTIIRKPLEIFLDTISQFIGVSNEDDKLISINSNGIIYFTTRMSDKPVSIEHLSSGEKQLLTFFSNLIFNVKSEQSGIFVVDEPELSLHLSWQNIFVEKTLEINKNIQLIFATHSPEIIGKYRDKVYRLNKYFSEN